jgi:hypothetical protein
MVFAEWRNRLILLPSAVRHHFAEQNKSWVADDMKRIISTYVHFVKVNKLFKVHFFIAFGEARLRRSPKTLYHSYKTTRWVTSFFPLLPRPLYCFVSNLDYTTLN